MTTRAMTTILLSPKVDEHVQCTRIKDLFSRTLPHQSHLSKVLSFKRPSQRLEPDLTNMVHDKAIRPVITHDVAIAQGIELAYQVGRCVLWQRNENNWAVARDFQQCGMCDQQRRRLACAYAHTDQSLLVA